MQCVNSYFAICFVSVPIKHCTNNDVYNLNLSGESSMVNAADIFIVDQDHILCTYCENI